MSKIQQQVRDFHRAMGQTVGGLMKPRIRDGELRKSLILEEAQEFADAVDAGDFLKAVDAIADLNYVSYGAAVAFGVEMAPVEAEVHRANMSKVDGPIREDGKRLKPPGWTPPDIEGCLDRQVAGYRTVIALLGHAGAGKTTVAEHLVKHYGATRVSFAAPLKLMAKELFGLSDAQLYGDQKEHEDLRYGKASRVIMQSLGSLGRKHLGVDVWVNAALHVIEQAKPGIYVIDDCRYPNEAQAVFNGGSSWSGRVFKVVRPGVQTAHNAHESETGVNQVPANYIDGTLHNDGDFSDLLHQVDKLMGAP